MLTRDKWWDSWKKYLYEDEKEITIELNINKNIDPDIRCCIQQEITKYHNMTNKFVDWAEKIDFQESHKKSPWN